MWSQHPAFADGLGIDLERNLLADLVEVDGGFRTGVDEAAVMIDGRDLLVDDDVRSLLAARSRPTTVLRAPNGLMGTPPPFIPDEIVASLPQHRWVTVPDTNHYTILLGPVGAAAVAEAVRTEFLERLIRLRPRQIGLEHDVVDRPVLDVADHDSERDGIVQGDAAPERHAIPLGERPGGDLVSVGEHDTAFVVEPPGSPRQRDRIDVDLDARVSFGDGDLTTFDVEQRTGRYQVDGEVRLLRTPAAPRSGRRSPRTAQ